DERRTPTDLAWPAYDRRTQEPQFSEVSTVWYQPFSRRISTPRCWLVMTGISPSPAARSMRYCAERIRRAALRSWCWQDVADDAPLARSSFAPALSISFVIVRERWSGRGTPRPASVALTAVRKHFITANLATFVGA